MESRLSVVVTPLTAGEGSWSENYEREVSGPALGERRGLRRALVDRVRPEGRGAPCRARWPESPQGFGATGTQASIPGPACASGCPWTEAGGLTCGVQRQGLGSGGSEGDRLSGVVLPGGTEWGPRTSWGVWEVWGIASQAGAHL